MLYLYRNLALSGFQNMPENSSRWAAYSDRAKSVHVSVTMFSCEGKRKRNNDQHLCQIKLKMPYRIKRTNEICFCRCLQWFLTCWATPSFSSNGPKTEAVLKGGPGWHRPISITECVRNVLFSCCAFRDQWSPDWKCSLLISSVITKKTCRCFLATFTISY